MGSRKRIPTVRDLEYLSDFLRGFKEGGRKKAMDEIRKTRLQFEREKDLAAGGGRCLDEKKLRLESLASECERLCKETGLMRLDRGSWIIDVDDPDVKLLFEKKASEKEFRLILTRRLLTTYRSFEDLLFAIRATEKGKIFASHDRRQQGFRKSVARYGIDITQWTFEAARDLATQLGLLNWRMLDEEEVVQDQLLGETAYVIYLVCIIARVSELQLLETPPRNFAEFSIKKCWDEMRDAIGASSNVLIEKARTTGYSVVELEGDFLLIKAIPPDEKQFEQILWREYLKLTDQVPAQPVYYCRLRDIICEKMAISDELFHTTIQKMISEPSHFGVKVVPGTGTVPLERTTSRKYIPPKLTSDIHIVYLMVEK